MATSMFVKSVLVDRVTLPANRVGANVRDVLALELARKLEGRCSRHGYVALKSISVEHVAPGVVQAQALDGSVVFRVTFRADVCNPIVGALVQATVVNKNRFGFLAEAVIDQNGHAILEIVVAKPPYEVERGDAVSVEVLGCKYGLNDTRIAVVGSLLTAKEAAAAAKKAVATVDEVLSDDANETVEEDLEEEPAGLDVEDDEEDAVGSSDTTEEVDSDADDLSDSEVEDFDDADDAPEGGDVSDDPVD